MSRLLSKSFVIQSLIVLIVLLLIAILGNYGLSLVRIRTRDSQRITDLNSLRGSLSQYRSLNKKCPEAVGDDAASDIRAVSAYKKLSLGHLISRKPMDPKNSYPFKYRYASESDRCALWVKMEDNNYHAANDSGRHKNYYEVGQGAGWQNLIPSSLP